MPIGIGGGRSFIRKKEPSQLERARCCGRGLRSIV
jgi:hypothetical protein